MTAGRATIIAAVITAVGGILAAVLSGVFSHQTAPAATSAPPTAPLSSTAAVVAGGNRQSVNPPASPSAQPATVLWQGQMGVHSPSGVDVGSLPIRTDGSPVSFSVYEDEILYGTTPDQNIISEWTGAAAPTPEQCADRLRTQAVTTLGIHVGLRFCTHGVLDTRLAFGQIVSYDGTTAQISLTVWSTDYSP